MTGPLDLTTAYGLGQDALNKVRAAAAEMGVSLPERQIVYFTPIPTDCDQVGVAIESWTPQYNIAENELIECGTVGWLLRLYITIVRTTCALMGEDGTAPAPELMTEAMRVASVDGEVMKSVIARYNTIGQGTITFGPPAGQFQDVELSLTLPGDGY